MALKTLENVTEIDGFPVKRVDWNAPEENPIEINDAGNAITFKIQDGPIKENGVNGCQVDTMAAAVIIILKGLNQGEFACRENALAITNFEQGLMWLKERKIDRVKRGVEGTNQS